MIPINELITKIASRNVKSILTNVFITSGGGGGAVSSVSGTTNQITVSPTVGAVVVSLPSNVIFPGTWAIGTLGYSDTGILWSAQSSTNSYNQAILQNTSNGATASTNFNVSNDQGTATTNFGEFGINSSGFTGSGAFSTAGYVYLASATTDLVIGTYSAKPIHFVVNMAATDALTISSNQNFTFNQLSQSSSWASAVKFNTGNPTAYTSTTEFIDFDFGTSGRTATWIDGTVALQRFTYLRGTAISKTTTSVVMTGAYTFYVDPPTFNAGVTGTPFAAGFNGKVQFTTSATLAGINIGSNAGIPSILTNADAWYNSSSNAFQIRAGATTLNIMAVNGTGVTGAIPYVNATNPLNYTTNSNITFSASTGLSLLDLNMVLGITIGTKFGNATNQKLSFWNATPIIQPTTAIATATRVGGGGTTVTDTDTFGGYKIGQIVQALQNEGLLA